MAAKGERALRSVSATLVLKALLAVALVELLVPAVGRVPPVPAAVLGLAVAALTYGVVDRVLLRQSGHAAAVLADFVLAVPTLWLLARALPGARLPFGGALTVGGAFTVAEILYHQYVLRQGVGLR